MPAAVEPVAEQEESMTHDLGVAIAGSAEKCVAAQGLDQEGTGKASMALRVVAAAEVEVEAGTRPAANRISW